MNNEIKYCVKTPKEPEKVKYYEVTEDNVKKVRNNSLIIPYAPNRPLDIKVGDCIFIYERAWFNYRKTLTHVPKSVFEAHYKRINTKSEILGGIKETLQEFEEKKAQRALNSMGCSENFYEPYYLIGKCFESTNELDHMTERELNNLMKLAEFAAECFY